MKKSFETASSSRSTQMSESGSFSASAQHHNNRSARAVTRPQCLPARSNVTIAQETISDVKYNLKLIPKYLKTNNKYSGNKEYEDECYRLSEADKAMAKLNALDEPTRIKSLLNARSHNCGDLAILASISAENKNCSAQVVCTKSHAYTLIGQEKSDIENLAKKMEDWPQDLAVCDIWSNIACTANEYPNKFREKMGKWKENNKSVFIEDEWSSPLRESFLQDTLHGERKEYGL